MNIISKQFILEYTYPLSSEHYNGSYIYIIIDKMRYYIRCNKEKYINLSRNRCYDHLKSTFGLPSVFYCGDMVGHRDMVSYLGWYCFLFNMIGYKLFCGYTKSGYRIYSLVK